jgi:hypothetical protein
MVIAAWVGLVLFGLFALISFIKMFFPPGLTALHGVTMLISFIVVAVCAGIIWGGLFQ